MNAYRYLVRGDVQGVGYRAFARREACRLGLAGFARNLPDGRVEVLAQGRAEDLEAFEGRLRQGPGLASVEDVSRAPVPPLAGDGFHIR